ncbi:1-acyl-sn-glycerol-3-phosphate acyltransferase [Lecanosticta acicola]|uniref:1-acyl-sn-glycerol-3-phosphate acyltransferase n=1 Tax=Lecanosticta acicola TaxID=111012 RepID=A0AAI8Z0Q4_9PEZI|nr:1-acyl-sn-glycerol-3-phosphate acyltransferase [Lecanosticta acicola]
MSSILFWGLTVVTAITVTVHLLTFLGQVLKQPALEYYGRSIASFSALFLCATYGTIASACLNVAGYGGLGQWTTARSFKWIMLLFTGVWFDIRQEDGGDWLNQTRPAVFVGNHQTELDVLFLGHAFPKYCSVTSKKSLSYVPFLGWFMSLSKTVFIERSSREQAVAAFAKAAEQMHSGGQSVYIFPEGTRSYYDHPDLLPFKKGAFHLAVQAQVPIVPIVVANYSNVLNVKRKFFRPGVIPARVLKPISTKGKTKEDVDALLEETRSKMLKVLKEITVTAREQGIAVKKEEVSGRHANAMGATSGVDIAKA